MLKCQFSDSLTRVALAGLVLLGSCLSSGCGPVASSRTPATLGYQTIARRDLVALPKPKTKIIVAVYGFKDQTGQYKYHPSVSSFSTAVTQGAGAMLIQALKDSGWFTPVEREGLNDLLTERKIIRAKLNAKDESDLPKLLHAPLLLEGGVTSYETNVLTAGAGLKYYGIGGSTEMRKDQVSLYLRAINVGTGEVAVSVSALKSILSQQVSASVFRFVDANRLLEAEAGFTTNEPPQLCVLEALEKAVVAMIVEGLLSGAWELENPADVESPVIQSYLAEKAAHGRVAFTPETAVATRREDAPAGGR